MFNHTARIIANDRVILQLPTVGTPDVGSSSDSSAAAAFFPRPRCCLTDVAFDLAGALPFRLAGDLLVAADLLFLDGGCDEVEVKK